jgi:hypothetical protein
MLGVAGIAAAAAIINILLGSTQSGLASVILVGSAFVGMILLFLFSRLVVSDAPGTQFAGVFLVWIVLLSFATFLVFTTSALIAGWPCNWSELLTTRSRCAPGAIPSGALKSFWEQDGSEVYLAADGSSRSLRESK